MCADQITEPLCYHVEGPVWWPWLGVLRWVDMLAHDRASASIITLRDGNITRVDVNSPVAAFLRPRRTGGAIIATEHELLLADDDELTQLRRIATVADDPNVRCNEGTCDVQGRVYVGTMSYDRTPNLGAYYRLDTPEGHLTPVIKPTSTSNGLAFTPDGARAYFVDTPTMCVDVFDLDKGELINRRTLVDLSADDARPDGLTLDADGGVWVALNGHGKVCRFDGHGSKTEEILLPARRVTSCTFGGDNLETLFITTSRDKLEDGQDPQAGAVFACSPGNSGVPTAECGF